MERKAAKRDLYSDSREKGEEEGMEDWDEDELNDVIKKKHGGEKSNQTDIVRRSKLSTLWFPKNKDFFRFLSRRSASTSWTRWRTTSTGGSGSAPTGATTACTGTRCRRDSCSKRY